MLKKSFVFGLLSVIGLLLLTACGGSPAPTATTIPEADETELAVVPTVNLDVTREAGANEPDATADALATAEATAEATPEVPTGPTILDILATQEDLTVVYAAIQAAGLAAVLDGPGTFTLFAPSNEAFSAALTTLELDVETLFRDTDTLTNILLYHVTPLTYRAADLSTTEIATVQGASIRVTVNTDGSVLLNEVVTVSTLRDIEGSNGVIHVIEGVLLPPEPEATPEATAEATSESAATPEPTAEATADGA
ncbi:MAG: fasciclin domain-containing protein [Anaerolineae bacterium]|jgi:uncharacterized surface protein with fasciclin (FAS1) repeats|nr:fasciclin domain-containing protein [Anaerolineae bacterium]